MEWEGDWSGLKGWVRTLFPTDAELDSGEELAYPASIELLAGSRMNLAATGHAVECGDLEEDDLSARVRSMIEDYLASLPPDRLQAYLKVRATRVVDGSEEIWTERDFQAKVWSRKAAPSVAAPPPPTVAGAFAAMRQPPAQPQAPAGGTWGAAARGQSPALSGAAVNGGIADVNSNIHSAVGTGEPISMLANLMMFTVQTVLAEHRFLIDHNAGLAQQLIGVLDNMARSNATDTKNTRKALEDLYATRLTAEVSRAASEKDAEVARLATELDHMRAALKETENRLRSESNATHQIALANAKMQLEAAKAQAENAKAEAQRLAAQVAAQPKTAPVEEAGMRGRLEEKVATAAERALEAVIAGVAAPAVQGAVPQQMQQVQQVQQAQPQVGPIQGTLNSAVGAAANAVGLGGMDLANVTPEMASFLLKMLPVETRKAALKTTMMLDPEFGAQFSEEVAEAIDAVAPEPAEQDTPAETPAPSGE